VATSSVVPAGDQHARAFAAFLRQTWDPHATVESVERGWDEAAEANPVQPGQRSPTYVFLKDEEVIGHLGTLPVVLRHAGTERHAVWLKGLMVLPEFRNGPVGYGLVKAADHPYAMAMVVEEPARRLFTALGFEDLGSVPNYLFPLDPSRVLRQATLALDSTGMRSAATKAMLRLARQPVVATPAGWAVQAYTRLRLAMSGRRPRRAPDRIFASPIDESACDVLWERIAPHVEGPVRSGRYLATRYGREVGRYVTLPLGTESRLLGLAVLRRPSAHNDPRLGSLKVATLADVVAEPTDGPTIRALLRMVIAEAASLGSDAVVASASHRRLRTSLLACGFVPIGANMHFLVRVPSGDLPLPPLDDWWLTRGDSRADESF